MKIFLGILLILLGLKLLTPSYERIMLLGISIVVSNEDIAALEEYVKKHPIQDEYTQREYEQEMVDYKNLVNNFGKKTAENKFLIVYVLGFLYKFVGLLYFITGVVLTMDKKWTLPMMGIIFIMYILTELFWYFEVNNIYDSMFILTKSNYKIQSTIGMSHGNYYDAAVAERDKVYAKHNMGVLLDFIIYLFIPTVYLVKNFFKDEKRS